MHPKSFDELIPHMQRAGFIATALAAVITSMFGWSLGEDYPSKVSLAGLLALCTFIVGYALTAAYHAYKREMRSVGHAAVALFVVAVAVEFLSHTGFTAANNDATIQKASYETTAYEDARGNVKDLEAKVARLTDERNLMKPKASVAAAKAAIANAEAHKFWALTSECAKTKGPQTRSFCDAYFSSQADVALWDQIAAQEIKLATAESELKDARAASGGKQAIHASASSQRLILASMLTRTENPDGSAQFWSGVGISALLALFAICAGGLLNFIAFAFDAEPSGEAGAGAAETVSGPSSVTLPTLSARQGLAAEPKKRVSLREAFPERFAGAAA